MPKGTLSILKGTVPKELAFWGSLATRVGQSLIRSFAHRSFPLIAHFRSFQKSDWTIARSFALLKKERMSDCSFCRSLQKSEWALALFLLFSKERPKEWSLFCSFKKSDKKSYRSFALSNRATKRAIALLLFRKEWKSKNERKWAKMCKKWAIFQIDHFSLKKRAIAHFQNERMPNPAVDHKKWSSSEFMQQNNIITWFYAK